MHPLTHKHKGAAWHLGESRSAKLHQKQHIHKIPHLNCTTPEGPNPVNTPLSSQSVRPLSPELHEARLPLCKLDLLLRQQPRHLTLSGANARPLSLPVPPEMPTWGRWWGQGACGLVLSCC